jgi:hypothetical protein
VRVGGARPSPFTTITITSKVAVYAPTEWANTLTLFHLYHYMYSVDDTLGRVRKIWAVMAAPSSSMVSSALSFIGGVHIEARALHVLNLI